MASPGTVYVLADQRVQGGRPGKQCAHVLRLHRGQAALHSLAHRARQQRPIEVSMNLAGKSGTVVKSVTVDSNTGIKNLLVKANIPVHAPPRWRGPAARRWIACATCNFRCRIGRPRSGATAPSAR
jgi:hypothetical protein